MNKKYIKSLMQNPTPLSKLEALELFIQKEYRLAVRNYRTAEDMQNKFYWEGRTHSFESMLDFLGLKITIGEKK